MKCKPVDCLQKVALIVVITISYFLSFIFYYFYFVQFPLAFGCRQFWLFGRSVRGGSLIYGNYYCSFSYLVTFLHVN